MHTSLELVALALLPLHWRRAIGAELRAGRHPMEVLERLIIQRDGSASVCGRLEALYQRAKASLDRAERGGIHAISWGDAAYPALVTVIADPPPVLWVRGTPAAFDAPAVAVVGSRAGSPYGLAAGAHIAGDLARRGVTVVSGLARGIDSAAHRAALTAGGATIAVLGSGVDVVYPPEHRALADDIAATGALVSELVPGTPPRAPFFPLRNRIISALARAVVVIEAGEKSGSLITARAALEQGRDVLAVPGNILNGRNRGGHGLLRDGAKIVETADDILEELGLSRAVRETGRVWDGRGQPDAMPSWLPPGEPRDLDAIAAETGLPVTTILARLLELELQGRAKRAGGGRFVRA
jgi:DNA processing protein